MPEEQHNSSATALAALTLPFFTGIDLHPPRALINIQDPRGLKIATGVEPLTKRVVFMIEING